LIRGETNERSLADKLNVAQSTISRDISELSRQAQQWTYSLARKNELTFRYKQSLDVVSKVKSEAFALYIQWKDKENCEKFALSALKLILECAEVDSHITSHGPSVLQLVALGESVRELEENSKTTIYPIAR
jgi:Trp operon repressor